MINQEETASNFMMTYARSLAVMRMLNKINIASIDTNPKEHFHSSFDHDGHRLTVYFRISDGEPIKAIMEQVDPVETPCP